MCEYDWNFTSSREKRDWLRKFENLLCEKILARKNIFGITQSSMAMTGIVSVYSFHHNLLTSLHEYKTYLTPMQIKAMLSFVQIR